MNTKTYSEIESIGITFSASFFLAILSSIDGQTVNFTWAFWGSILVAGFRSALKTTYIKYVPKI